MRTSTYLFGTTGVNPTERFADLLKDLQIPGTNLMEIDNELQARFFQKKPGTNEPLERWELKQVTLTCSEDSIRNQLDILGFMHEEIPLQQTYDYAGWPGALVVRAAARLKDLIAAWEVGIRWKEVIVFGGKRALMPEKENFTECCKALGIDPEKVDVSSHQRIWNNMRPQTELEMMKFLWHACAMPERLLRAHFVDSPMKPPVALGGNPVRPNTEDTIHTWLESSPKPGSMLVSTGAPYCMAQNEAFWMILGPKGFTVETFGHETPTSLGVEVLMREVAGTVNRIYRARCG